MGEYARQEIMGRYGVDIGEDEPAKPRPKIRCRCGKMFYGDSRESAYREHLKDKHPPVQKDTP